MKERFGFKDFALLLTLAVVAALQVMVLLQKHNDAAVMVEEVRQGQKRTAELEDSLAKTNSSLRELTDVLRKAAGAGSAQAGGLKIDASDLGKVTAGGDPAGSFPRGDALVWCLPAEPRNLNPLCARDLYARYVRGHGKIFETLLDNDLDTLELKGVLAESWKSEDDGKLITIVLKPDLRWSDGKPLTADDVVFSVETVLNPKIDCPDVRNYLDDLERIEKVDGRTVRFRWKKKYFKSLEQSGTLVYIIPKHVYGRFVAPDPEKFNRIHGSEAGNAEDPVIGSGPYVLKKWDVGSRVELVRNENYWGRKPSLDGMIFRFIKNEQAALQAFRNGEVDMISPTPRQYDELAKDPKFLEKSRVVKFSSPLSGYTYVGYNCRLPLFSDKRVRQALTMALDRQLMIREMWFNIGQVGYSPFYQGGKQTAPDVKPWPYDLEKARALLAEAGWKDTDGDGILDKVIDGKKVKFEFEFLMTTDQKLADEVARYLQDQMSKLGIRVTLAPLEWSSFLGKVNNQEFQVTMLSWGGGDPESDPYQIWHSSQAVKRGSNFVGFNNKRADELIEKAREELDEGKRNALYHEFHRILHDEQPYTFVTAREFVNFIDRRFENVKVHKLRLDPVEWYVPVEKQKHKS
jgi:peptide/nickel transport system substrate-binding protein